MLTRHDNLATQVYRKNQGRNRPNYAKFRNTFIALDLVKLEMITPDILDFYHLYYNRSDVLFDRKNAVNFIERNLPELRAFVKYIIIQNALRSFDDELLALPINNKRSNKITEKINEISKTINLLPKKASDVTSTEMDYYIATFLMKGLSRENNKVDDMTAQKADIFALSVYLKILKLIRNLYINNISMSDVIIDRDSETKFKYFVSLLRCHMLHTNPYEQSEYKVPTNSNVMFLLGFYNPEKLLLINRDKLIR